MSVSSALANPNDGFYMTDPNHNAVRLCMSDGCSIMYTDSGLKELWASNPTHMLTPEQVAAQGGVRLVEADLPWRKPQTAKSAPAADVVVADENTFMAPRTPIEPTPPVAETSVWSDIGGWFASLLDFSSPDDAPAADAAAADLDPEFLEQVRAIPKEAKERERRAAEGVAAEVRRMILVDSLMRDLNIETSADLRANKPALLAAGLTPAEFAVIHSKMVKAEPPKERPATIEVRPLAPIG